MDVKFIEKDADAEYGKRFDTVGDGDVVILPAFGASLEEMQLLDSKGVTTVDTTCPWVSKVWTVVDKHQKASMTSIIHGEPPAGRRADSAPRPPIRTRLAAGK